MNEKVPNSHAGEPAERSASGLRDLLFQSIEDLRTGRIDVAQANAISKSAEAIIKSVEMQVNYERLRITSEVPGVLPAMPLVPRLKDASR